MKRLLVVPKRGANPLRGGVPSSSSLTMTTTTTRTLPTAASATATATAAAADIGGGDSLSSSSSRRSYYSNATKTMMAGDVADRCNINLIHSPFPPIQSGPYLPLYEFVTRNWKKPHHQQEQQQLLHGHYGQHNQDVASAATSEYEYEYLNEQIAIVDATTNNSRTFHDYAVTTQSLGTALHDLLVDKDKLDETNATVAFYAPNHVDYLPTVLAVSLMGAKVTPINPLYTHHELEPVLQRSRASVLIAHTSVLDTALEVAKKCPLLRDIIVLTDDEHGREPVPDGTINYHALVREYEHNSHHHHHHNNDDGSGEKDVRLLSETHPIVKAEGTENYPVVLPYSSGTTGLPKGVCLTHANLVTNLLQFENVEGLAFAPEHKLVSPLPFFHIYAFTASLMYCGWKGHTLITMSGGFDLENFCKLVEEHKPQRAHLVPPILVGLAKHPIVDQYDLSSLQTVISAAAPLGIDTEAAASSRLNGILVKQAWGMSELSPIGTVNSDYNAVSGSIGPLVASTTGKIVDGETGKSLPAYEQGDLAIKGPQVMLGYLDDPEKTSECLSPNGWLRTGDMAYYDDNGFFFITDRIKELIKVKGFQVPPAELEDLLHKHPAIADAAVIGIPDDEAGELPRAYVVLKPPPPAEETEDPATVTEQDIADWVEEHVVHYKRLKGGVVFTDAIPRSASGKILRRVLRDSLG